MYYLKCGIEAEKWLTIDLTMCLEQAHEYVEGLISGNLKGVGLTDTANSAELILRKADNNHFDNNILCLTQNNLEIISTMISDVQKGNAFPGYHYDLELNETSTINSAVFVFLIG